MSTKKSRETTGGTKDPRTGLNGRQLLFISEYLKCRNSTQAARAAGYKSPANQGCVLMNENLNPLVVLKIREGLAELEAEAKLEAKDVLAYIHSVMTFQPLLFFRPGPDGWETTEEEFKNLPKEVHRLVENVTVKHKQTTDSTGEDVIETIYSVSIVSKATAMALAAKHQLGEINHNVHHVVNWNDLARRRSKPDLVEQAIADVERLALPAPKE